jgi:hypothetical protein
MSVRRAARLALLWATAAALLGSAAPAAYATAGDPGGGNRPAAVSPGDAYALAATPTEESGAWRSVVDAATALAASSLPGAQTSVDSDLSPDAAVGLARSGATAISAALPACWANAAWHQWGTWPYQQRLTDTTYWCAVYGSHITYRTSSTTASGTLCGTGWTANQLIGGGIGRGFKYFTVRASAGFSCATVIPWFTIHTTHHEDVKRNARGGTTFVGVG